MFWLAVLVVGVWFLSRRSRRRTGEPGSVPFRYRPMLLLVGVPGSGKTYKMVHVMVQRLAEGRFVRTNYNVRHDRIYLALRLRYGLSDVAAKRAVGRISHLDRFEDVLDAVDCDVFIDEAQDLLSSTDWQMFPQEVVNWFAQHRHRRCRVVLASHRWGSIHNYVRDLVGDIELARPAPWFARMVSGVWGNVPVLQYVEVKNAEEGVTPSSGISAERSKRSVITKGSVLRLDPLVASCYDTEGGVRKSPMQLLRDERNERKGRDRLVLAERRSRHTVSRPGDGLPFLEHGELVGLLGAGFAGGGAVLGERWASWPS